MASSSVEEHGEERTAIPSRPHGRTPLRGRYAAVILIVVAVATLVGAWTLLGGRTREVTPAGVEHSWKTFRNVAVTCVETSSPGRLLCSVGEGARVPVEVVCDGRSCIASAGDDSAVFPYRPE